jgi:hypothetical protein
MSAADGGVVLPTQFLTVGFGTPIDIGLVPATPGGLDGELLTVQWRAKFGTSYLPFDPDAEQIAGA